MSITTSFLKLLPVIVSHLRDAQAGLRIVAVHVEDGRLHHARDVGGIRRGARFVGIGGEADLVVDHQVNGAARGVAFQLRKIQRLGHHALPRESRVAVDQDRDDALALRIAQPILLGTHDAFHHRVDRFRDGSD